MSFRATSVLFAQVRPILVSAAESGVDVEGILDRLGLVEGMRATDPERRLELKDYYRIQRDIAQSLDACEPGASAHVRGATDHRPLRRPTPTATSRSWHSVHSETSHTIDL